MKSSKKIQTKIVSSFYLSFSKILLMCTLIGPLSANAMYHGGETCTSVGHNPEMIISFWATNGGAGFTGLHLTDAADKKTKHFVLTEGDSSSRTLSFLSKTESIKLDLVKIFDVVDESTSDACSILDQKKWKAIYKDLTPGKSKTIQFTCELSGFNPRAGGPESCD